MDWSRSTPYCIPGVLTRSLVAHLPAHKGGARRREEAVKMWSRALVQGLALLIEQIAVQLIPGWAARGLERQRVSPDRAGGAA